MLKMVDGTGIIGVDMVCPLGISTPQPPNYDRVELEGTGILVLPNSLDAPLERLELGGKTEQVTTTGKNLFDSNIAKNKENYKEVTIAGSVIYAIELSLKPNTKYAFQCVIKSVHTTMNVGNSTIRYVVSDGQKRVITTNEDGKLYIGFSGNPDGEIHKIGVSIVDIQVEESTTVTPYEPYTGGKPSPSPEYLQEIKNSGKWNEETQKYEVDVNITGKNLFDKCLLEGGEIVEFNGVEYYKYKDDSNNFKYKGKFKNGQQYALTTRILRPESKKSYGTYIKFKYEDGTDSVLYVKHGGLKTLVSNIGKTIDSIIGNHNYATDCYLDLSVTRLSRGGQDSGYQPYKEQTLTITSDRPLTKWDRLVEQGGEIGWLYQSAINEYRGDTVIAIYQNGFYFLLNNKKLKSGEGYCEELKQYVDREEKPCINFNASQNTYAYTLNTQAIYGSTTSAIKEYLKTHPLHLVYKTETTEFIPLPQSEQNAIRALKTYYPTTVITVDGGELDPDIKVTYRKEI